MSTQRESENGTLSHISLEFLNEISWNVKSQHVKLNKSLHTLWNIFKGSIFKYYKIVLGSHIITIKTTLCNHILIIIYLFHIVHIQSKFI